MSSHVVEKKGMQKRVLLSIIGSLSHACKVVKHRCLFLRKLMDLAKLIKKPSHYVLLNREARSDIEWWFQFSARWIGISMMYQADRDNCSVTLVSDASGSCGAFCVEAWFQLQWPESTQDYQITVK